MTTTNFAVPVSERYFEDYISGLTFEYGEISLTAEEIVNFAKRFDPQHIHADPEAAERGPFAGLIASGWHTAAIMMRLFADHYLSHVAGIASPGVDELRWTLPVRPGDSLSIRVTILGTKRSRSKPNQGTLRSFVEVMNQKKEVVMSLKALNILRCRSDHDAT
jgi:acyl dehydratase